MVATVGAGLVVGAAACAYALLTGHSPAEVALSGQRTLPVLATDPAAWSTGALVALVVFKAVAYGVSLGAFRGGATFPAVLSAPLAGSSPAPWHQDWRCCPDWRSAWPPARRFSGCP